MTGMETPQMQGPPPMSPFSSLPSLPRGPQSNGLPKMGSVLGAGRAVQDGFSSQCGKASTEAKGLHMQCVAVDGHGHNDALRLGLVDGLPDSSPDEDAMAPDEPTGSGCFIVGEGEPS